MPSAGAARSRRYAPPGMPPGVSWFGTRYETRRCVANVIAAPDSTFVQCQWLALSVPSKPPMPRIVAAHHLRVGH